MENNHSITEEETLELIAAVSKEDENAFRRLYEATHKRIFQYLFRITNSRELAEDIMVDTYSEVWKSAKKFGGRSKVSTWIIGIARNLAMGQFRKRGTDEYEIDEDLSCPPTQFLARADCERTDLLGKALDMLSSKHREVLDLVFLQEMNYEDISQITGIPANTVKTRVFYAKEKLREIFDSMGIKREDIL